MTIVFRIILLYDLLYTCEPPKHQGLLVLTKFGAKSELYSWQGLHGGSLIHRFHYFIDGFGQANGCMPFGIDRSTFH